jgi:hypothetical protein
MLASNAVNWGSSLGICCFSDNHTELMSKNEDWLAWNEDNVSE